jgi:predicted permease
MFSVEGLPQPPIADVARVSPGYFRAMGVRVKEGRVFTEHDRQGTPRVCVVDETFARTYWPNQNALGKRVKFGPLDDEKRPWLEVVGVVSHVKNYGVDGESRIELYMPYLQDPVPFFTLLFRTEGDPASLTAGARQAVTSVNPDVPVFATRPLTGLVDERTAQRRLAVILISVFGGVALLLAGVGIYGVMSYAVTQRTQEIGIRMALGARRAEILRMVLGHGTTMALAGVSIGLVVAFGLARLITSQLFQVSAADPPTFSIVPLLLIAVAVFACYLPARRATAVDPMVALRSE